MNKLFANCLSCLLIFLMSPNSIIAQVDVTQFLGIPVDGYRPEMVTRLKSKGFIVNQYSSEILDGEFNGQKVNVIVHTNNNKVWRIAVADAYDMKESDVRIHFNKLVQQFGKNKNYMPESDSVLLKFTIPEEEDISYEMSVKKKRYEAVFYQKSLAYDSVNSAIDALMAKDKLSEGESKKLETLMSRKIEELVKCFNKQVWFAIMERSGQYYVVLFYENAYNKANGEDL